MSGVCTKCSKECVFKENKTDIFGFPCDICKKVICRDCANLSATEIRVLVQTTKRMLPFLCEECLSLIREVPQLKIQVTQLQLEVRELKEGNNKASRSYADVLKFQAEAEVLKGNLSKLEQRVGDIGLPGEEKCGIEPAISEMADREKRASNVMLFGLPESSGGDLEERRRGEMQEVAALLSLIDESVSTVGVKIHRIGRPESGKIRPVKIVFQNKATALQILKQKKKLDNIQGRYIKGDLTLMQRKILKNVVAELQRRTESGEKDLKIKYFNSIPKIIQSKQHVKKN